MDSSRFGEGTTTAKREQSPTKGARFRTLAPTYFCQLSGPLRRSEHLSEVLLHLHVHTHVCLYTYIRQPPLWGPQAVRYRVQITGYWILVPNFRVQITDPPSPPRRGPKTKETDPGQPGCLILGFWPGAKLAPRLPNLEPTWRQDLPNWSQDGTKTPNLELISPQDPQLVAKMASRP